LSFQVSVIVVVAHEVKRGEQILKRKQNNFVLLFILYATELQILRIMLFAFPYNYFFHYACYISEKHPTPLPLFNEAETARGG
jgi:hypothetical protein